MKRFISTTTILEPYGLVNISGEVSRNGFYGTEDAQFEPPFDVRDLRVTRAGNWAEVLHGTKGEGSGRRVKICNLDQVEIEKCHEVLIEKFLDDEGFETDRLIDEAIESGRQYRHLAYA